MITRLPGHRATDSVFGINAPDNIKAFLDQCVHGVQEHLTDRLTGIYLHGSLAMGCFNPTSSDIDVLVVVNHTLTAFEREALAQRLLALVADAPRPVELSVITLDSLQHFRHPSPYELHISESNRAGTMDLAREPSDPDLAAHFVITKARGVSLCGAPVSAVFPEVPRSAYLESIVGDFDWSYTSVMQGPDSGECRVPKYAVLNACRILAFIRERIVTSKREGGEWGMQHLPAAHLPLIRAALDEYLGIAECRMVDARLLKHVARECHAMIHSE